MQTLVGISEATRIAFEQVQEKVRDVFPDSEAELRPSTFGDEGGMVIIHTNTDGFESRYDLIIPIRELTQNWREHGVAFGFDVAVREMV